MRRVPRSLRPMLARFRADLEARFGERLHGLTLFGSYAAGTADEDSDVDVLVLIEMMTDDEIGDVASAAAEISIETGFDLSPLPLAAERFAKLRASGEGIAAEIERTGMPL